jgi:hypothetical protein
MMAEKVRYPQIPSTVWWGVRSILQRTPSATIDERLLGVQLGVQEAAARAYVSELRSVGILTEEGKATPLAQRWRLDESYADAVQALIPAVYPEGLIHVAPPGEGDRQKIVSWFQREGLGQGAAGNKAATYLMLGSATPNEAPSRGSVKGSKDEGGKRPPPKAKASSAPRVKSAAADLKEVGGQEATHKNHKIDMMPLNVNVQIHIGADAGSEQIEAIFVAMRRYLYADPAS